MYPEKTTDKIMIPQWEYRRLRDIATRVDVLKAELEYERQKHNEKGYDWELTMNTSMIVRILGLYPEKEYTTDMKDVETLDSLSDALDYTE